MRGTSGGVDGVGGEGGGGGGERSDPDDQGETQARVSETLSHFIVTSQPPIPLNSKMTGQTRYIFHQLFFHSKDVSNSIKSSLYIQSFKSGLLTEEKPGPRSQYDP